MDTRRMVASRLTIVVAAILCLVISIGLFLSGLEATPEKSDPLNMKLMLSFEGTLGILVSAFNLTNETLVSRGKRLLLSVVGACFLTFQGLFITEFGIVTNNGWQITIVFGIPVTVLSILVLILNSVSMRSRLAGT